MSYTGFEWDEAKNQRNIRKHGISFLSAATPFNHFHFVCLDEKEAYGEDRWLALGWIGSVLGVVVFAESEDEHGEMLIRIISARKASSREIELYEKKF